MMAAVRVFATLFLVCYFVTNVSAQKKRINCETQKQLLDIAVDNMTMMMNEWEMGYGSMQELDDEYCIPFLEWLKTFNGYKPCLKAFPRTLFAFVGTNIKKLYKEFCQTQEKKQIAYNHLKCFNATNKPFFLNISVQIKNYANFISELPEIDDIIPGFCCGYLNMTSSLEKSMNTECTRMTGARDSGTFLMNFVQSLFVDAIDIMCGKYAKPADCRDTKIVRLMDQMTDRLKSRQTFPFKSPVLPVLVILDRMDGKVNIDE